MTDAIEALLDEQRTFPPPPSFAANALTNDRSLYEAAAADRLAFWETQASHLDWFEPWTQVLDWSEAPFAQWFVGGRLNVSYNCLDRHVEAGHGERVAYHWEGEPGDNRSITYAELLDEVSQTANAMRALGVGRGDRVAIYMPMIPELAMAMLACARIGAVHSVVFGGFSSASLSDRINDAEAKLVVTADGGWRRGAPSMLKPIVDEALTACPTIDHCLVVQRIAEHADPIAMQEGRDLWWHELVPSQSTKSEPEAMDSEDLLYLLYTSGTTGKPKGIMHSTGGYLTQVAFTHRYVFDLKPETDVYWCAADIGWVTGHSYIVYGPLANGCTSVMYEGTPDTPRESLRTGDDRAGWPKDRLWDIIERHQVTQLYTAPTAIRTFMKWGVEWVESHDLSSLRLLGSVGEPINPEAWMWYHTHIGREQAPIVDTWWQTETGAMMISPLPGVSSPKPGSAMAPLPGISAELVDDDGNSIEAPGGGYLTLTEPWPSMLRGIWGDSERFVETYWSRFPGRYFAGDGAKLDADGDLWLLGRVDDVMNISGHRISTTEVESALVDHESVAEAAVVGRADSTTGQAISAFVILRGSAEPGPDLEIDLRNHVATLISPIAKPAEVVMLPELPKTRSGKIMRRLLRDLAEGQELGDVTTLADTKIVGTIQTALRNRQ